MEEFIPGSGGKTMADQLSLCGRPIEDDYLDHCGDNDMGQLLPAICAECWERLQREDEDLSMWFTPFKLRDKDDSVDVGE